MQKRYQLEDKAGITGLGAGVWNLGPGGDPFGGPTREAIPILDRLPLLAEAGMSFYEAHDHEIPAADAEKAVKIAPRSMASTARCTRPRFSPMPFSRMAG